MGRPVKLDSSTTLSRTHAVESGGLKVERPEPERQRSAMSNVARDHGMVKRAAGLGPMAATSGMAAFNLQLSSFNCMDPAKAQSGSYRRRSEVQSEFGNKPNGLRVEPRIVSRFVSCEKFRDVSLESHFTGRETPRATPTFDVRRSMLNVRCSPWLPRR
ncbi:MAG: hypothetical protein JWM35_2020 [Verrucomicrobia bacterium]|nr:hypothetical protein [Verrucomicrobiota bacterium]